MIEERATLLIVEDDTAVADMLKAYFLVQGYDVVVANWGEQALQQCADHPVDLVLLDIRLPDMDGFEVANRLRKQANRSDLPILFLAEQKEKQFRLRGMELAAQDYITKPFEIDELGLSVRNAIQRQRRRLAVHKDTHLPQGELVDERLKKWLQEPSWALLLLRLTQLDYVLNLYGYTAASEILQLVGRLLEDTLYRLKINGFVGHYSETEFLLVIPANSLSLAQKHLLRRLTKTFQYLARGENEQATDLTREHFRLYNIPHAADITNLAALKIKLEVHRE